MATAQRDQLLDALKGAAICFVVAGHVVSRQTSVQTIFAFHMPLMFFLSGITAGMQRTEIARRAYSLLVPYLAWSIIVLQGAGFLGAMSRALLNPRAGQLWYLYTLFEMYLLVWVIANLPGRPMWLLVALGVGALLLLGKGSIEPFTSTQVLGISDNANAAAGLFGWRNLLWFTPFFGAGYLVGDTQRLRKILTRWTIVASGTLLAAALAVVWPPLLAPVGIRYLLASLGIALASSAVIHLEQTHSVLSWIGRRSLGIYALHGLFIGWVPRWFGPAQTPVVFACALAAAIIGTLAIERSTTARSVLLGSRWPSSASMTAVAFPLGVVVGLVALARIGSPVARAVFLVALMAAAFAGRSIPVVAVEQKQSDAA